LGQIVEGFNYVIFGALSFGFEILELFFKDFVLSFCLFILQHQVSGIDLINGLHQHLAPFFLLFSPFFKGRRIS
jgi:hypothetical protein